MKKVGLIFVLSIVISAFGLTFEYTHTTYEDFIVGEAINIDIITPDPDGMDNGALQLTEFDTIYVLQVYPDGHCIDCITSVVDEWEDEGIPPLNFKMYVVPLSEYNDISSPSDDIRMQDADDWSTRRLPLEYFNIVFFGIANGFGGRSGDLNNSSKAATIEFVRMGRGLVLTHDTVAKRTGWRITEPLCTDTRDFEHERFNTLNDVSGLGARWVNCYASRDIFNTVNLNPSADPSALVLNVPFNLPATFDVTDCHDFGEVLDRGTVWYSSDDGRIYMQTFNDPDYNSYSSFFSTGHEEEDLGDAFRPLEWETKAMINSMYYAYNGGEGVGDYKSTIIALPSIARIDSIVWSETLPPFSSLRVQARISEDSTSWTDWYEVSSGEFLFTEFRYLQYRVLMDRGADRPILHWIKLFIEAPLPVAELISPINYSSCECARVLFSINSDSAFVPSTFRAEIDGTEYGASSFSMSGDTLIFEPHGACFAHGDTIRGSLTHIANTAGFDLLEPVSFEYVNDLEAPVISSVLPEDGSIIGDMSFDIYAEIVDDLSGTSADLIWISVNGESLEVEIPYDSLTGIVNLPGGVSGVFESESVTVCIHAGDRAELCGSNMGENCQSFYVDIEGPEVMLIDPLYYTSCDSLSMTWLITDLVPVDSMSIRIILDGIDYTYPEYMNWSDDSFLVFTPPYELAHGESLEVTIRTVSDSLGNSTNFSEFHIIQDSVPPIISGIYPPDGYTIGDSLTDIAFFVSDLLAGFDTSSVIITIGDSLILYPVIHGDSFLIPYSESPHFENEDTVQICISASDLTIQCTPNMFDTCFTFEVNLSGPLAYLIYPTEGSIASCDSGPVIMRLVDPNGVEESSIEFSVEGINYDVSSSYVSFDGETLTYYPEHRWTNEQIIDISIFSANDLLSNPIADTLNASFTIDKQAPSIIPTFPLPGMSIPIQPDLTVFFEDNLAGYDSMSIRVEINSLVFTTELGSDGLWITDDTLHLDFNTEGIFFEDTVFVTIMISDNPEFCEPNDTVFSYFFVIDQGGPYAEFIEPDSGIYSSCESQEIRMLVLDYNGVDWSTLMFEVNGNTYSSLSLEISTSGDTLVFEPAAPYANGELVEARLLDIADSLGNHRTDTIYTSFIVDLTSPVLTDIYPTPGDTIFDSYSEVYFNVVDSLCGIDESSILTWTTEDTFELEYLDDEIRFNPIDFGIYFPEESWFTLWLSVNDCAVNCGANSMACSTYFYLPDDDIQSPEIIATNPVIWAQDSIFDISITLRDSSSIYCALSSYDSQAPILHWTTDGSFVIDVLMEQAYADSDSVVLVSTEEVPPLPGNLTIYAWAEIWDNDYDFDNIDDRSMVFVDTFEINIVPRPIVRMVYPYDSVFTSCEDQNIIWTVESDDDINYESLIISVDGEEYTIESAELEIENDTIRFTPTTLFSSGAVELSLVYLEDINGYPARIDSWVIFVDLIAPEITALYPSDGEMLGVESPYAEFELSDDLSGVSEQSIMVSVLTPQDTIGVYDITNCVEYSEGIVYFSFDNCGIEYEGADSFILEIIVTDSPDTSLCDANENSGSISFWLEPQLPCSLTTNPFTPNSDGYNDIVTFIFPEIYSRGGKIEIFDMRGIKAKTIEVEPTDLLSSNWDGTSERSIDLPAGIYMYLVTVDGEKVCKGTITLAR